MNHRLLNQITAAEVTEEEIKELFDDLKFIYENPFQETVEKAIVERAVAYIEINQPVAH